MSPSYVVNELRHQNGEVVAVSLLLVLILVLGTFFGLYIIRRRMKDENLPEKDKDAKWYQESREGLEQQWRHKILSFLLSSLLPL